jgi:hypothetical protein
MARRSSKRKAMGRRRRTMRGGTIATSFSVDPAQQDIIGAPGGVVNNANLSGPVPGYPKSVTDPGAPLPTPYSAGGYAAFGGRRRKTKKVIKKKSVAAIKRLLKAKGLKVSGSRRAVTARARKARIPMKGGRSPLTGAPYRSYQGSEGNVDRGLASEFNMANPVNNNVLTLPGYGAGSSEFISSGSGGLVPA